MRNAKWILGAVALSVLLSAVSTQAVQVWFSDSATGSPALSNPYVMEPNQTKTIYIFVNGEGTSGLVFEGMVGYDNATATTKGKNVGAGQTGNLSVANISANVSFFTAIGGVSPTYVADNCTAAEANNAALNGRPYGFHVIAGKSPAVVPGAAQLVAQFDLTNNMADGGNWPLVLSTDATSKSFSTQWKDASVTASIGSGVVISSQAPVTNPAPTLSSAVSRKTHTGVGDFNIALPAVAPYGIECRIGGPTKLVLTFNQAINSTGIGVTLSSGTLGAVTVSGSELTINLTGATDKQWLVANVTGVTGTAGTLAGSYTVTVGALYGDVNYSKLVNATDTGLIKSKSSAAPVDATNFKYDINASGLVNATDTGIVKTKSSAIGLP